MLATYAAGERGARAAARSGAAIVVVDAYRASTTIAVLVQKGARVLPVAGIEEAANAEADYRIGERGSARVKGFDFGNSPTEVRDVKSRDLNAYIKEVMGPEFSPKDFRTWAGTLVAAVKLAELGAAEDEKKANKNVLAAVDAVAERLGNTRAIARSSYVSPRVIEHYLEGSVIACQAEHLEEVIAAEQGGLTEDEQALLELLQRKLRRELEQAA